MKASSAQTISLAERRGLSLALVKQRLIFLRGAVRVFLHVRLIYQNV